MNLDDRRQFMRFFSEKLVDYSADSKRKELNLTRALRNWWLDAPPIWSGMPFEEALHKYISTRALQEGTFTNLFIDRLFERKQVSSFMDYLTGKA